jgi:hypothetical protein
MPAVLFYRTWRLSARDGCQPSSEVQTRCPWRHGELAHSLPLYRLGSYGNLGCRRWDRVASGLLLRLTTPLAVTPKERIGRRPFTGTVSVSQNKRDSTDVLKHRSAAMAAAYHGGAPGGESWVNNSDLRQHISNAMDWWFARDFTTSDCLYSGGKGNCSCGTAGMWNTNWFSNVSWVIG